MSTIPVELEPSGDHERTAAAHAVIQERKLAEHDALVDALTERERLLMEVAYERGQADTRDALRKALANPQAATLDAKAVATVISTAGKAPKFTLEFRRMGIHEHYDPRIVNIVRSALRYLPEGNGTEEKAKK